MHFQAFPHLRNSWRNGEGSLPLWHAWWKYTIWIHYVEVVTGLLDCFVLQGSALVVHHAVGHAELAVVGLLHVLVLVGLQVRLELVLMLRQRQDHNAGDVSRRGPQGQIGRDYGGSYRRHILCARVDEILIALPLAAAPTRLTPRLHGRGFRRWQGSEVQVVLVCFYQHLSIRCQPAIVHQGREDGLGPAIFGLRLKQTCQFGHAVHGAPAGVEVVALLFFSACHFYISPPVVADAVDDDAGKYGAHCEGEDDGDRQQGHGNQLVTTLLVALADHTCKETQRPH